MKKVFGGFLHSSHIRDTMARDHIIRIRVSSDESDAITASALEAGMNRSAYIRACALGGTFRTRGRGLAQVDRRRQEIIVRYVSGIAEGVSKLVALTVWLRRENLSELADQVSALVQDIEDLLKELRAALLERKHDLEEEGDSE